MLRLSESPDSARYGRRPFTFDHDLQGHPLLALPKLRDLVLRLPAAQVYHSSSKVKRTDDLDTAHKEHKAPLTLAESLASLETAENYIMVRSPDNDPEYRPLLGQLLQQVKDFTRARDPGVRGATLYLFISSPHSVTPFHVDRYITFLMQIAAEKSVFIWEPWKFDVIRQEELERYIAVPNQRGPKLQEAFAEAAGEYRIAPGRGVHIPFVAPHWVKNGPGVSISISIIFNTLRTSVWSGAMRFNYRMRNRHGRPLAAPPRAPWDMAKFVAEQGLERLGRRLA